MPYEDPPGWRPQPSPLMPPPPPPMPEGFANKVTSGKAIASLVLGLAGLVGVLCHVTAPAALVGLVLGGLGIRETGANGTRKGRGFALAGLILCCVSIAVYAATFSALFYFARQQDRAEQQREGMQLEQDLKLVAERLQQYYAANGNSLGPGGVPPVFKAERKEAGNTQQLPGTTGGRVSGPLNIAHLVDSNELQSVRRLERWQLHVTSPKSAVVIINQRRGGILAEAEFPDAAKAEYTILRR
jgi:hypothetical protein